MVFEGFLSDSDDVMIVAAIKAIDDDEVAEKFGDISKEELEDILWREVDKINENQPFFKSIRKCFCKIGERSYKILLLSGKTQKDKIILLEALYNRTSGVHFQKASPP